MRIELAPLDAPTRSALLDDVKRVDWMLMLHRDLARATPSRPKILLELDELIERVLETSPGLAGTRLCGIRPFPVLAWPEVLEGLIRAGLFAHCADSSSFVEISLARRDDGCLIAIGTRQEASFQAGADSGIGTHLADLGLQTAIRLVGMLGGRISKRETKAGGSVIEIELPPA